MTVRTTRTGFTPMPRQPSLPGRRTANIGTRDALLTRQVGRTVLHVYHGHKGTGALGRTMVGDSYSVVALGNTSREARTIGSGMTYDQAVRFVEEYNPRLGLLK